MALLARMSRELKMLSRAPPTGVQVWPVGDQLRRLEAVVTGPEGSPYASGHFRLSIDVSERYPFEPPKVQFVTPIYHPNIDDAGRICLDTLKMPPAGAWRPSINLGTLLAMVRLLMAEPNPDDGLMPDITRQYRENRCAFESKARSLTQQHAIPVTGAAAAASATGSEDGDARGAGGSSGRPVRRPESPSPAAGVSLRASSASASSPCSSSSGSFSSDDEESGPEPESEEEAPDHGALFVPKSPPAAMDPADGATSSVRADRRPAKRARGWTEGAEGLENKTARR